MRCELSQNLVIQRFAVERRAQSRSWPRCPCGACRRRSRSRTSPRKRALLDTELRKNRRRFVSFAGIGLAEAQREEFDEMNISNTAIGFLVGVGVAAGA